LFFLSLGLLGLAHLPTQYASACVDASKIFIYFHTQKPLILLTQTGLPGGTLGFAMLFPGRKPSEPKGIGDRLVPGCTRRAGREVPAFNAL